MRPEVLLRRRPGQGGDEDLVRLHIGAVQGLGGAAARARLLPCPALAPATALRDRDRAERARRQRSKELLEVGAVVAVRVKERTPFRLAEGLPSLFALCAVPLDELNLVDQLMRRGCLLRIQGEVS